MISKTWAQHEIYERTSSVPLTYHYSTTIQKTSSKRRASPYLWSTSTVPLFFIFSQVEPDEEFYDTLSAI